MRSFFELLLDEYLYSRHIDHTPEVKPFKNREFRCDQKVGDFYIELWGYSDFGTYAKRRRQKERFYRRRGLTLIPLEVSFFRTTVGEVEKQFDTLFSRLGFSVAKKEPFSMRVIAQAVNYPWNEDAIKEYIGSYVKSIRRVPDTEEARRKWHEWAGYAYRSIWRFPLFPVFDGIPAMETKEEMERSNDHENTTDDL